jgi:hypothetical protein
MPATSYRPAGSQRSDEEERLNGRYSNEVDLPSSFIDISQGSTFKYSLRIGNINGTRGLYVHVSSKADIAAPSALLALRQDSNAPGPFL